MKVDLTVLERGYVANTLRKAAMTAQENARATKSDLQRAEFTEEVHIAETLAIRFDDGEALQLSETEPIRPNPRADLDYLDGTGRGKQLEAKRPRVRPELTREKGPESPVAGAEAAGDATGGEPRMK